MASESKDNQNREVRALFFDSYIATIKNSVGSKLFQTLWAEVDGEKQDVTQGGELSCAAFVSSILYMFELLEGRHATTASTVKDLERSGWRRIEEPREGGILVWEDKKFVDGYYPHIGFYMGDEIAISNSNEKRMPQEHHWTYGENEGKSVRKVVAIYWHPRLNDKYF